MNIVTSKTFGAWRLPILSGILIGTSYIPFPPWASLFCFVPLWIFWNQQARLKQVFIGGLVTAFVFTLIGFNWVTYLLHEFAHLNWALSVVGMLFYALIAHLFVPLAGVLWFVGQRKFQWSGRLSLGLMVMITVLCEANSFTLFDWNFGYSWYGSNIPVYQWAEIIGFSGLSALTLLCNLAFYMAWEKRRERSGKIILAGILAGFLLMNVGGLALKTRFPQPDATLKTLLVQASIDNAEKLAAELDKGYGKEIFNRYLALTDKALASNQGKAIDFALWPETAFPALLGKKFQFDEYPLELAKFLSARQLPLITGAYGVDESSGLITNSLFIIDKNGNVLPSHYSKTVLLAFGEYIPGENYFPEIRQWLPPTGHFARGAGPTSLLNWNDYNMGAQICYESLFPAFSRSLAELGAQFIVNVTNDSWYGTWQEPYQHFYMTLARGVEFRRPVLRVTNTGISTVSLATGEILQRSPIHQPWTGIYEVPYLKNPPATFYQKWFWLGPSLLWSTLLMLLVAGMIRKHRS
ncbi:MAG: apolipoprotein N-acyltransferase [Methylococcaceae bacterium]|nr:apolipoprotein N-acyltransferase [Methylococcaceae bacterium]